MFGNLNLYFDTLWANLANDKFIIFFLLLLLPENRPWLFMQIVSFAWNVNAYFLKNKNKKNA